MRTFPKATPARRFRTQRGHRTFLSIVVAFASVGILALAAVTTFGSPASAATASVDLGVAGAYSVVAGSTVTNTGPSVLSGSLGLSPGSAITGFPPGLFGGDIHAADAAASRVQSAVANAWTVAAGRAPNAKVAGDLVGRTLTPGVYKSTSSLHVSGTVTLNAQGNPASVFIFQIASTLITSTSSKVKLVNGAQACHIYWQVGSSATLGVTSVFKGTILALSSITANTGATVEGRALARNGAVTLDDNVFTSPGCDTASGGSVPPTATDTAATTPTSGDATTPGRGRSVTTTPGTFATTPRPQVATTPGTPVTHALVTPPLTTPADRPHTPRGTPHVPPAITGSDLLLALVLGSVLLTLGAVAMTAGNLTRRGGPKRH